MAKVYEFKYWCITEEAWIYELRHEADGAPTQCKNSTEHSIDSNSIALNTVFQDEVLRTSINAVDLLDPLTAITSEQTWDLQVKIDDTVSIISESWPFPVDMVNGYMRDKNGDDDDYIEVYGSPYDDYEIGTVTQAESAWQKVIHLSTAAFSAISVGAQCKFGTDPNLYRVAEKTSGDETITLTEDLRIAIAADAAAYMRADMPIGVVAEAADVGSNQVKLSSTAYANSRIGYRLKLGSNTEEYRIDALDDENSVVTLRKTLKTALSVNDLVYLRRMFLENFSIDGTERFPLAHAVKDVSGLPVGMHLVLRKHHASAPTADRVIKLWLCYRM